MMNCYFFRRVTSSILASLFALTVGIGSVKSLRAEDTKRLTFCRENRTLFHLDKGAERKVRIAVFDFGNISFASYSEQVQEKNHTFTGIGKILAGELAKNNNFSVVNWNQIKPTKVGQDPSTGQAVLVNEDTISLEKLRYIRNKYGVEAVINGSVNLYDVNGEHGRKFLVFGTTKKNNEVYVKLNFRVVDTATGDIVLSAEGNGRDRKSYTSVTVPKINVNITNRTDRNLDINSGNWTSGTKGSTIEFTLNSSDEPNTIISSKSNNIFAKLLAVAAEDAINQIVEQLNFRSNELACLVRKPTLIAEAYFDSKHGTDVVILNKGRLHGYCKGMTFSIERSPHPVIDPVTGRVLRVVTNKVGTVKLSEVDAQSSLGIGITEPGQSFLVKDIAKLTPGATCPKNQDKDSSPVNPEPQNPTAVQEN